MLTQKPQKLSPGITVETLHTGFLLTQLDEAMYLSKESVAKLVRYVRQAYGERAQDCTECSVCRKGPEQAGTGLVVQRLHACTQEMQKDGNRTKTEQT